MNKRLISIGETAKILSVSLDTLRLWEKKGILLSFRPTPTSKRYYRTEDIDNFLRKDIEINIDDLITLAKKWVFDKSPTSLDPSLQCKTSDVFQARLQRFGFELNNVQRLKDISPLIVAVCGEIGNNSYNHNIGNWSDMQGVFFGYKIKDRQIVIADRGRGILETLKRVVPSLKNDQEALRVAFTEYISGRAPENRGNGLKFVKDVVSSNFPRLTFYTGNAKLELKKGMKELEIEEMNDSFHGCMAIIYF